MRADAGRFPAQSIGKVRTSGPDLLTSYSLRGNSTHRSNGPQREVGLFALIFIEHMKARFFLQLELVGFARSAGTNQALPLRRPSNIFNVCPITVSQTKIFHQVLYTTVWTLHVKTSFEHFGHRSGRDTR